MKKKLLILSTILLTSNSLADNNIYFKAAIGVNQFSKVVEKNKVGSKGFYNISTTPLKSVSSIGFGIGYQINENFRTELILAHDRVNFNNGTYREKIKGTDLNYEETLDRDTRINSAMLNGYVDMPISNCSDVFVGAGVGMVQIQERLSTVVDLNGMKDKAAGLAPGNLVTQSTEKVKRSKTNNFAYSLIAGGSIKISTSVKFELAYSYKDFGKTKPKIDAGGYTSSKAHYKSHNISAGIRISV